MVPSILSPIAPQFHSLYPNGTDSLYQQKVVANMLKRELYPCDEHSARTREMFAWDEVLLPFFEAVYAIQSNGLNFSLASCPGAGFQEREPVSTVLPTNRG